MSSVYILNEMIKSTFLRTKKNIPGGGSVVVVVVLVVVVGVVGVVVVVVVVVVVGAPPSYGGQVDRSGICWFSQSVKWETSE